MLKTDILFNCEWSQKVVVITVIAILFIFVIILSLIRKALIYRKSNIKVTLSLTFITILLSVISVVPLFYMPQSILIDSKKIIINRLIGKKQIQFKDIDLIEQYSSKDTSVRIFASGGLFGYIGYFKSDGLLYKMFVLNESQMVSIKTKSENIVLSCNKRDSFIRIINELKVKAQK